MKIALGRTPAAVAALTAAVDVERDRRLASGFAFNGSTFQARQSDLININGAASNALVAIQSDESLRDSLRWFSADVDFAWIDAGNAVVPMTAQTVMDFAVAASAYVQRLYFCGLAIKEQIRAGATPADIKADALW